MKEYDVFILKEDATNVEYAGNSTFTISGDLIEIALS